MLFIVLLIEFKLFSLQYSIEECFIKIIKNIPAVNISSGTALSTQHRHMQQLQSLCNNREDANMEVLCLNSSEKGTLIAFFKTLGQTDPKCTGSSCYCVHSTVNESEKSRYNTLG